MITYTKRGEGPPIVFIHGFLSGASSFEYVVEDLAATNTIISVDLPGIGASNIKEGHTYTVEDYAREIQEVLAQEGIEEATWLGHSMGGYVALAAADERIAQVNQLILLFSSDLADGEEAIAKREKQKKQIEEEGVSKFVDGMIGNFFPEDAPEEAIEFMRAVAKDATVEGMVQQLAAMQSRKDRSKFIENAKVPISIIEGTNDKILPPIETDGPNVQRVRIPTGHMGMAEKPALVIDAVRMMLVH